MSGQLKGYVLVVTAGIIWGFNGLFVSALGALGLEPIAIAFTRYAFAALLMVPLLALRGRSSERNLFAVTGGQMGLCAVIGTLCNAVAFAANCVSMEEVGVSSATVLLYTAPVFGCLLARALYKERVTIQKLAAFALNLAGVVLVVTGGGLGVITQGSLSLLGIGTGLLNALLFALAAPLNKPIAKKCSPFTVVFWSMGWAALASGLLCMPMGASLRPLMSPLAIAYGTCFAGLASVIAYLLYTRGIASGIEASRVPVLSSVEAVVAALLGACVFGEPFGVAKLAGIVCVVGSIFVMNAHAPQGQVYGVHFLPPYEQVRAAYQTSMELSEAIEDLRKRREDASSGHITR